MIIFGVIVALFIVTRWVVQPDTFYQYGHYRGKALSEIAAHPTNYAAAGECGECHDEQAEQNAAGSHAKLSCQMCHGPGGRHLAEPAAENIIRPEVRTLCLRCHEANFSRPKRFPQIQPASHTGGRLCSACHTVHNPGELLEQEDAE